jgi:23S rRNA U2552 (ribose-2'-O)-methylase RlmE/FtsJ
MINNKISTSIEYPNRLQKLYSSKLYQKFIEHEINKETAYQNNEYNMIVPNLKILPTDNKFKHKIINGYSKMFYKNNLIEKVIEYCAFYPETFYYVWEILNNFNLVNHQTKKIMFVDNDINDNFMTSLGHLEAVIKYCEDNFNYEKNEYIRVPLNKCKYTIRDKKFASVYSNHQVYDFTMYNNIDNKIYEYFKNSDFDLIVNYTYDIKMLYSILKLKEGGCALLYIDDFMNTKNDNIISTLSNHFKTSYIYQPVIQDKLDTSCWLILIEYNNTLNLDVIKNITIGNNIINKIRYAYIIKYIDELLNLYSKTKLKTNEENDINTDYDKLKIWAHNNNLILKHTNDTNFKKYKSMTYIGYDLITENNNKMSYTTGKIILHKIKRKLNEYKRIIDTKEQYVNNNCDDDIIDWNKLTDCIDLNKNLRKIISWKCNSEMVNNTWLKFYEILSHENIIDVKYDTFKSMHLCENTGSFIFSLNHYIKTKTNIKSFEWYAHCNSYKNDFNCKYDLLEIFPNNWLINNNPGDNLGNISTIRKYLNDTRLTNINLVTCDGSIHIPSNKFNEQESYVSYVIFTQIYTMLHILNKNGNAIIKMFLPFADSMTLSMLFLLYNSFNNVRIVKPSSSHSSSSEIYCICKKYCGISLINDNIKNKMAVLYNNYTVTDSIYNDNDIDGAFIDSITKISEKLCLKQISSIERSLYLRNVYYYDYDIQNNISIEKEEYYNNWIIENKIECIENNLKIFADF